MSRVSNITTLNGVAIVGGGLVGCTLALLLRRRGFDVDVFESRFDPRTVEGQSGRSINLVLTSRGFHTLDQLGLVSRILDLCTPVYGRSLHNMDGSNSYQAYGPDPTFCNYSISRSQLNCSLMTAAEEVGVRFHFCHPVDHVDIHKNILYMYVRHHSPFKRRSILKARRHNATSQRAADGHGYLVAVRAKHIFATDGANSRVRQSLSHFLNATTGVAKQIATPLGTSTSPSVLPSPSSSSTSTTATTTTTTPTPTTGQADPTTTAVSKQSPDADFDSAFSISGPYDISIPLHVSYMELLMPPKDGVKGQFALDKDALHIWPRGEHFLMGLPNGDGSFTMTLYMPDSGENSFKSITTDEHFMDYIKQYYPNIIPLIPNLLDQWHNNPRSFLGTIQSFPWHYRGNVVLLGDAAHAVTPFFGQGCNLGMETALLLAQHMDHNAKVKVPKVNDGEPITPLFTPSQAFNRYTMVMSYAFSTLSATQKLSSDAIAAMAAENYVEMSSKTADPHFLKQKECETLLADAFPGVFLSRYAMVTHTLIPYAVCYVLGEAQRAILNTLVPFGKPHGESPLKIDLTQAEMLLKTKYYPLLHKYKVDKHALRDVTREIILSATNPPAAAATSASATPSQVEVVDAKL